MTVTIYAAALFVHIALASIALASGFAALLSPKGGRIHAAAGQIFLPAMLVMTTSALALVVIRDAPISIVPSMLTFYLVVTGWRTVARKRPAGDPADIALLLMALGAGVIGLILGAGVAQGATGVDKDGFPAAAYFIFGGVALIAAAFDVRMIAARGVRGAHRLARHLWRMGLALLIATTSFFQGQEKLFPEALQGTLLLRTPALIVLGMMAYWLLRLMIGSLRRRRRPLPAPLT